MWENPDYFEFVLFDQDDKQCEGTIMLLKMKEDGKKYLLYNPNPSERLISQVSYEITYHKLTKIMAKFAEENGFDGLVVNDTVAGHCTNRTGGFAQTIEKNKLREAGQPIPLKLKESHHLGGSYSFGGRAGDLHYLWKRE
jgi:hypothetical protein